MVDLFQLELDPEAETKLLIKAILKTVTFGIETWPSTRSTKPLEQSILLANSQRQLE